MVRKAEGSSGPPLKGAELTRERIIKAARTVFFQSGYSASLDEVAQEAEVGRRTVYNLFESKEDLFRAVVYSVSHTEMVPIFQNLDKSSIYNGLVSCGVGYLEMILTKEHVQLYRLMASDLVKFPDLAQYIYTVGIRKAVGALAQYLEFQMDIGCLRNMDAEIAAEQFLASVVGTFRHRALLGIDIGTAKQRVEAVEFAADRFIFGLSVCP